jgi:hypothetical protein
MAAATPVAQPANISDLAPGNSPVLTLEFPPTAAKNGAMTAFLKISADYLTGVIFQAGNWGLNFRCVSLQ